MGLLDILQGNGGGSQYGGLLYPSPLTDEDAKRQTAAADLLASMGISPTNAAPAPPPFGDPTQFSVANPSPSPAPPPSSFGAGATPFGFAGAGSNLVNPSQIAPPAAAPQPASPIAAPPVAPAPPAAAPAPTDEQAAPINVGSYAMPRVGSADDFEPDDTTPAKATPTQGQLPAAPAAAPFSLAGNLGVAQKSFQGTSGLIPGIANAVQGLITGQPVFDKQTQARNATAKALAAKGVSPELIEAAATNPEIMKTLIAQNFGPDKFQHVTRKDALGGETIGAFDPTTGKTTFEGGGGGGAQGPGFGALMAQGMTYDPNKTGDAYLAQFGPEVQAAAKAYIHGDVMPTGNARLASIASFAKTVAQKWGQDTGNPVNDSTYAGKRNMAIQLTGSSNSSMGGILSNGESSFSHLAEATKSMADLGNASHNFPLGGLIAHGQNYIGNNAGGSNTQAKILATIDNLGKYGAESTKFYAGTGGGVEERTAARKDVDPNSVSGEEMAAFAEKEKGLMLDRLNTKFQEIRNTYGEEEGNAIIAKHMPQIQKNIATIDANVARMRGEASGTASGGTAPLPAGNYVWTPNGGVVGGK